VSVVKGTLFEMHPENNKNCTEMKNIISDYLATCKTVIIRGTLGEAGMSLYKTQGNDISEIYQEIAVSGEKSIIIEPFLNVSSSPNDQWVISRDGNINSLGMRDQICERGMVHIGTLKREKISPDTFNYITKTSAKIVNNMAEFGYRGVVGIDYILSDDGIFPVENNARFNGSSYVSMIVDNIEELISPIPLWKFIKITLSREHGRDFQHGRILERNGSGKELIKPIYQEIINQKQQGIIGSLEKLSTYWTGFWIIFQHRVCAHHTLKNS
jgi:hypothetical protein